MKFFMAVRMVLLFILFGSEPASVLLANSQYGTVAEANKMWILLFSMSLFAFFLVKRSTKQLSLNSKKLPVEETAADAEDSCSTNKQKEGNHVDSLSSLQQMYKTSRIQLETVLHAAGLGYWDIDFNTRSFTFNLRFAEILGYSALEIQPTLSWFMQLIHPDDAPGFKRKLFGLLKNGNRKIDTEIRIKHKEGRWVDGIFKGQTVAWDSDNRRARVSGILADLSEGTLRQIESKKLSDTLVVMLNDFDQFSQVVSHHLRAPVANIIGLTNVLLTTAPDTNQAKELIVLLESSAKSLDSVIRDMNKMLHVKFGDVGYIESFDLSKLLITEVEMLKEQVAENDAQVTIQNPLKPVPVHGIQKHFSSIVHELITNALKFREPRRPIEITLGLYRTRESTILYVKDNGLGFDAKLHNDKIFEMYRRIHNHVEGKGLGLYIVKALTERINGQIRVYSKIHKGSIFKVTFINS